LCASPDNRIDPGESPRTVTRRKSAVSYLERDLTDLDSRVVLPVSPLDLVLQHRELPMPSLRDNLARNLRSGSVFAHQKLLIVRSHGHHFAEGHFSAHFAGKRFHLYGLSRRDTVLLASTADNGVHPASSSKWETHIIRALRASVN